MFSKSSLTHFLNTFDENKREIILKAFIQSFEKHIETCRSSNSTSHANDLKASLHDIKSLCYTLKADEEGQIAEKLEKQLIDGDTSPAIDGTADLTPKLENILTILKS